jgi:hypothetical protein
MSHMITKFLTANIQTTHLKVDILTEMDLEGITLSDAENPPGGGFSADKTDSLVWREVQ